MAQTTNNTNAFIHAQQYSAFILTILHDGLLPTTFYRDVSDFGEGTTLNIKTIGQTTIQDVEENTPLIYNPIETGNVQLTITDYIGHAWFVTDILKQDGAQIEALMQQKSFETSRRMQEDFESRYLAVANSAQTSGNLNNINNFAHRFVSSGSNQTMENGDLIRMKLAFDKGNVPQAGRIAIVDPVVEATLLQKYQGVYNVDSNARFESVLENNFSMEHKFIMNIFGWDIWTSNRLPRIASETIDSVAVTGGVANIFMSVLDDNTKPLMVAFRQPLRVEGERNKDFQRDEFVATMRWGVGTQRVDTLGVVLTDDTATS